MPFVSSSVGLNATTKKIGTTAYTGWAKKVNPILFMLCVNNTKYAIKTAALAVF